MVRNANPYTSPEPPVQERRPTGRPPKKRLLGGRIGNKALARFCHNVGGGLHAGVDIRRVFESETMRGSARQRREMAKIRSRINGGDSLANSMRGAGGYFPPLLVEMVEVGERTGRLGKIPQRVFVR